MHQYQLTDCTNNGFKTISIFAFNILFTGSKNQFWNYEFWIFQISFDQLCVSSFSTVVCLFAIVFCVKNQIGYKIRDNSGFIVSELIIGSGEQHQIIIPIRFHEKFSQFLDKKYIQYIQIYISWNCRSIKILKIRLYKNHFSLIPFCGTTRRSDSHFLLF